MAEAVTTTIHHWNRSQSTKSSKNLALNSTRTQRTLTEIHHQFSEIRVRIFIMESIPPQYKVRIPHRKWRTQAPITVGEEEGKIESVQRKEKRTESKNASNRSWSNSNRSRSNNAKPRATAIVSSKCQRGNRRRSPSLPFRFLKKKISSRSKFRSTPIQNSFEKSKLGFE